MQTNLIRDFLVILLHQKLMELRVGVASSAFFLLKTATKKLFFWKLIQRQTWLFLLATKSMLQKISCEHAAAFQTALPSMLQNIYRQQTRKNMLQNMEARLLKWFCFLLLAPLGAFFKQIYSLKKLKISEKTGPNCSTFSRVRCEPLRTWIIVYIEKLK